MKKDTTARTNTPTAVRHKIKWSKDTPKEFRNGFKAGMEYNRNTLKEKDLEWKEKFKKIIDDVVRNCFKPYDKSIVVQESDEWKGVVIADIPALERRIKSELKKSLESEK